jgi:hypothetical protein
MGKLLGLFIWIKPRLQEPSTFASLAAVAAMAGQHVTAEDLNNALNVLTIIFGSLGFFVAESGPVTTVK